MSYLLIMSSIIHNSVIRAKVLAWPTTHCSCHGDMVMGEIALSLF